MKLNSGYVDHAAVIVPRAIGLSPDAGVISWERPPGCGGGAQLGVTAQSIYNWRNQDQVDRGLRAGVITTETAELAAARKRIRALETE